MDKIILDEIKSTVREATREAVTTHFQDFFIPRAEHWEDHRFIGNLRRGMTKTRNIAIGFIVVSFLGIIGSLMVWGFIDWIKKHF